MRKYYKLVDKQVVEAANALEAFGDEGSRRVALTDVGPYEISTVFLGINHGIERLLLFETMVFDDEGNTPDCERYETYDEAVAGHKKMVARYQNRLHQ